MSYNSYVDKSSLSDTNLLALIGGFIKSNRLRQNKTQAQVAKAATLSRSTLSLLERGETVTTSTLIQVLRVLDLLHVMEVFESKKEISPLILAKLQEKERQRASNSPNNMVQELEEKWEW